MYVLLIKYAPSDDMIVMNTGPGKPVMATEANAHLLLEAGRKLTESKTICYYQLAKMESHGAHEQSN